MGSRAREEPSTSEGAVTTRPRRGLVARTVDALGPVLGGVALDLVDLASFGPLGPTAGLLVGGLFGWWLSGIYRVKPSHRPWLALAAGMYCALPMTEALPLATIASVVSRFAGGDGERDSVADPRD